MLFDGVSDHTSNLDLYKLCNHETYNNKLKWFEMHMAFDDNAPERKWSKTFEELKELIGVQI